MQIEYTPAGPPEIVREDGWRYRLEGIGGIEMEWRDDYDSLFDPVTYRYTRRETVLKVTIFTLCDKTLDSIRVLRDELTNYTIRLQHDY